MLDRPSLEALFLANLDAIERIATSICRRHGLGRDDTDDFTSWTKLRFLEDDYGILRKFRGESSLTTYLTVVVALMFRDYRVQRWGRWRPSAAARKRGALAVRLETLVYRDRLPLDQAVQVLRSSGANETACSPRELARLLRDLPARQPVRPIEVGADPLDATPTPATSEALVTNEEAEHERQITDSAMCRALDQLPPEDRVILRMRFWESLAVADIARALGIPQKPLYRRIDRLLVALRTNLESLGISRERVRELLSEPAA